MRRAKLIKIYRKKSTVQFSVTYILSRTTSDRDNAKALKNRKANDQVTKNMKSGEEEKTIFSIGEK